MSDEQAKKILTTLSSQRFSDWYTTGQFDEWISGQFNPDTGETIPIEAVLASIKRFFGV